DAVSGAPAPRLPARERLRRVRRARARSAPSRGLAAVLSPRDAARGSDGARTGCRVSRAGPCRRDARAVDQGVGTRARADGTQERAFQDAASAAVARAAAAACAPRGARAGRADMAGSTQGTLVGRRRSDRSVTDASPRASDLRSFAPYAARQFEAPRTVEGGFMARRSRRSKSSGLPHLLVGLALGLAVAAGVYFSDLRSGAGLPDAARRPARPEESAARTQPNAMRSTGEA